MAFSEHLDRFTWQDEALKAQIRMRTLSLSLLPLPLLALPTQIQNQSHFSNRIFSPPVKPLGTLNSTKFPYKTIGYGVNRTDSSESVFHDEDGVVDDMEGYLNHLSLEYDSVWDTKPSWCQPWTITLTGVSIIALSWLILQSVVVTSVVLLLICTWWYIFLYSYPKAYTEMIAERRERVTEGVEDTFGRRKKQ